MPGPNKRISKIKIYDDTQGSHRVTADGSECYIGGSKFKRVVLPSIAVPRVEDQNLNSDLEDIDSTMVKEADGSE